jgi:hypothetical protein
MSRRCARCRCGNSPRFCDRCDTFSGILPAELVDAYPSIFDPDPGTTEQATAQPPTSLGAPQ